MEIAVLGIDIGKNVCSVVGLDDTGAVVCAGVLGGTPWLPWLVSCQPALSRWKRAVAPTILADYSPPKGTTCA
jgi:hypothetical protein